MIEVIGYSTLVFGLICGLFNWLTFAYSVVMKKHTSFIPYIGAAFILVGMFLIGNNTMQNYWWLAFLIEFTTLPVLIIFPAMNLFLKGNDTT
ncbi:hypothetical protein [Arenicella xantha]|uniref:Uncharacterized protein n=1 Tax=Arenicella xantha TaxID=644221 RepID=A0A395JJY9_9GAMM|nr:hypothetical protein [Arenicella xantha]RBP47021.1 hypothetical protein DFR28_1125 [Arenicella xantha]